MKSTTKAYFDITTIKGWLVVSTGVFSLAAIFISLLVHIGATQPAKSLETIFEVMFLFIFFLIGIVGFICYLDDNIHSKVMKKTGEDSPYFQVTCQRGPGHIVAYKDTVKFYHGNQVCRIDVDYLEKITKAIVEARKKSLTLNQTSDKI